MIGNGYRQPVRVGWSAIATVFTVLLVAGLILISPSSYHPPRGPEAQVGMNKNGTPRS